MKRKLVGRKQVGIALLDIQGVIVQELKYSSNSTVDGYLILNGRNEIVFIPNNFYNKIEVMFEPGDKIKFIVDSIGIYMGTFVKYANKQCIFKDVCEIDTCLNKNTRFNMAKMTIDQEDILEYELINK